MHAPAIALHPLLARSTLVLASPDQSASAHLLDECGMRVGGVEHAGRRPPPSLLRGAGSSIQLPTAVDIRDASGILALTLRKLPARALLRLAGADGQLLGYLARRREDPRLRLQDAEGAMIASTEALDWPSSDVVVLDAGGVERARMTARWDGLSRATFAGEASCALHLDVDAAEPLRSLSVAAAIVLAVTLDTPLRPQAAAPTPAGGRRPSG